MQAHPAGFSLRVGGSRRGPAWLALAVLLGACASLPTERVERLEQRVERIEGASPQGQLDDEAAAVREQARRVDALIAETQAKLAELDKRSQSGSAERTTRERELAEELGRQRKLGEEVSRLRATVEQFAMRLEAVEKGLAESRRRGGERLAGHPREVAPPPSPAPAPAKPPKAPMPDAAERMKDKTGYLAFAREQERQGAKGVARELYEQYVNQFPTDPTAAEAHFRLGELAFADRRYRDAIIAYGRVARDFPKSEKVPDALLRTADSMLALDMKDEAASVLSEIPQRYPQSAAAERARKQLAELPKGSAASGKK